MIVKIWPIKGVQGTKNAVKYIANPKKVIKTDNDPYRKTSDEIDDFEVLIPKEWVMFAQETDVVERAFTYASNAEKTGEKYISGYLCDPNHVAESFQLARDQLSLMGYKIGKKGEREVLCYHLVQSFPEDLDISNEEVHQCGIELLEKLGNYQGVVCSHVHPVVNEKQEVRGKCKHNHILINAYIQPDKIDPKHPKRIKYNDRTASYHQLRKWNDEIALDHGLPIITMPRKGRGNSWKQADERKRGNSWKSKLQKAIETVRKRVSTWEEYKREMQLLGYDIIEEGTVTYTISGREEKINDEGLGEGFTKDNLLRYWEYTKKNRLAFEQQKKNVDVESVRRLRQKYGEIYVKVPIAPIVGGKRVSCRLPICARGCAPKTLQSYFSPMRQYEVSDSKGNVVARVSGGSLYYYLCEGEDKNRNLRQKAAEERARRENWERAKKEKEYSSGFKNSETGRYYTTPLKDEDGRPFSLVELIIMLAIVVLKGEADLWEYSGKGKEEFDNEAVFGPVDWKLQNMFDMLDYVRTWNIETPDQMDERVNDVGAAYSRDRAAYQKTKRAHTNMLKLAQAVEDFEKNKEMAQEILNMQEGEEKEEKLNLYWKEIGAFESGHIVMLSYGVKTQGQINDFKLRFKDVEASLGVLGERYNARKEEYRQAKKMRYTLQLAQTEKFCYGPEYNPGVEETEQREKNEKSWPECDLNLLMSGAEKRRGNKEKGKTFRKGEPER